MVEEVADAVAVEVADVVEAEADGTLFFICRINSSLLNLSTSFGPLARTWLLSKERKG